MGNNAGTMEFCGKQYVELCSWLHVWGQLLATCMALAMTTPVATEDPV